MKRVLPVLLVVAAAVAALLLYHRDPEADRRYTGFVEGEERLLRSEVSGRVLEVAFGEGEAVPAGAVVARLDDADIAARIESARRQIDVLSRQIEQATIQADLREASWKQDVRIRQSEADQAQKDVALAERTAEREESLARSGATTRQLLDDTRNRLSLARTAAERTANLLEKVRAEEATVAAARAQVSVLQGQKDLAASQLAELEVTRAKFEVRAPGVATVVQTQLLWAGELAQPGTPVASVLDPRDKYVQIYIPVRDLSRIHVGSAMEIELDSTPDKRFPGEVSFIADRANFTPEKIETRSDRIGQVYRVKVRVLDGVEGFTPGAEGNVFLKDEAGK